MKIKNKFLCIAMLATVMLMSWQASAASISMNFVENATNQILTGGTPIGPIGTDGIYWNHNSTLGTGSTYKSGTQANLIDDTGANTGVGVTWLCAGTWWTDEGTGSDETKLSVGYLDDGVTTDPYGVVVTFTNVPYARYRVYGMYASDTNQGTSPYIVTMRNFEVNGVWVLGGNAATRAQAYGRTDRNFTANGAYWTEIEPGVVGNYWTIETMGSTLTIKGLRRQDPGRGSLSAVIIEELDKFLAYDPDPSVGKEVPVNQVLTWKQLSQVSDLGVTYKVYFGTEPNELKPDYYGNKLVKTTTADPADFFFDPELTTSTKYYWRVDALEPNLPGAPIVHTGGEWWFTTQPPSPRIETNPVSQTVPAGTAQVQMSVAGINIATYEWYKDGVKLTAAPALYTGENTATLTILDVQLADEGFYYCVGDNSLKQPATSASAQLLTERLVGWWKLDGDLADSIDETITGAAAHDGSSVDPNYVAVGKDGGALQFFGDVDGLVIFNNSADFFNFYPRGYTVSAWVNMPEKASSPWGAYICKQGADPARGFILTHQGAGQPVHTLRQSFNDLGSNTDADDNNWHLVTGTYNAVTKVGKIYVDGALKNQATNTATVDGSPANLIFGAENLTATTAPYNGLLDDVRIWSYPLSDYDTALLWTDFNPGMTVCLEKYPMDVSGPEGTPDCIVNLYDFAAIADKWLTCNRVPESTCP
ncbi:MAG: LamG-like jellyroll fold domain-containing protein [Anaerohalosphaeraceae bacterium]